MSWQKVDFVNYVSTPQMLRSAKSRLELNIWPPIDVLSILLILRKISLRLTKRKINKHDLKAYFGMVGSICLNFTYLNCFEMFGDVLNIWSGLERIKKKKWENHTMCCRVNFSVVSSFLLLVPSFQPIMSCVSYVTKQRYSRTLLNDHTYLGGQLHSPNDGFQVIFYLY